MKKVLLVFLLLFASGCATIPRQITITDPSHLRVLLRNDSSYVWNLEGAVHGKLMPHSSIEFHVGCRGTFEGIGRAYKVIGKTNLGEEVLFPMGEQLFSFRTDGRNFEHLGKSYDTVVALSSPRLNPKPTHYLFYGGPCGIFNN